ncbi:MAG TPA: hypothetical protein DCL77_09100 [Prolixibacteraceae bacterium]|jgi:hypothetical protein|nr:hypothetical protein [Prolixibacteraceae bacterium]
MKNNSLKQRIIREIVKENGGTVTEVEQIIDFQAAFVANTIKDGGFEGIFLPYLGKFHVIPYRIQKFNDAIIRGKRRKGDPLYGTEVSPGI